jgi:hypothetical protein
MLETWKVHPPDAHYEPVAQIQMFQGKDGEWSAWSVMPRDRVYGIPLAAARNEAERNKYGHTPNARRKSLGPIEQRALEIAEMLSRDPKQNYAFVPADVADSLAQKGLVEIIGTHLWEKKVVITDAGRQRLGMYQRNAHTPNHSSVYYVWLLDYRGVPIDDEGPYGPQTLSNAEPFARIGAERGEHDRVVSIGRNPESDGFEIVRHYRRGTGERMR